LLAKIQTFAVIYQIQLKIAIEKTVFPARRNQISQYTMFLFQVVLAPVLKFKTTTWPGNFLDVENISYSWLYRAIYIHCIKI
jgi:hypothetical protein